ncbi:MAG: hypothetical protein AB7V08_13945 [Elusimicrobiales bacterium]
MMLALLLATAIKAEAAVTFRVVVPERIGAGVVQVDRPGPRPPVQRTTERVDGVEVVTLASP